ncbi:hypothetical protein [Paenibacillus marinisediminis]
MGPMFVIVIVLLIAAAIWFVKSNKKTRIYLLSALLIIILAHQFTAVQRATARLTAALHVTFSYSDRDFTYMTTEYSSAHGAYMVLYQDQRQDVILLQVESSKMPIVITYDSLHPGP